jgi:dihydroorotate dehydrogenase
MNSFRRACLAVSRFVYERLARPVLFRSSAQTAHHRMMRLLFWLDSSPILCGLLGSIHRLFFENSQTEIGGVKLSFPLILAAGMVKGEGFQSENEALAAVDAGRNVIPGWRSVPKLVGLVEFGSFTRHPRLGNAGMVIWRDPSTQSTQNRVGLKNPGAVAAAAFLAKHRAHLPPQFGINIAVSPGVDNSAQQQAEIVQAASAFLDHGIYPTWFTLNISCPNTEDDPTGNQTETQTRQLCAAFVELVRSHQQDIPLWVKVSPGLAAEQYRILMRVFHEVGVKVVLATNTLGQPSPEDATLTAGLGGGKLHTCALDTVRLLVQEKTRHGYDIDVVACGGVMDGRTYQDFLDCGAAAVQYWSALIYRGPMAAAIIQNELKYGA